MLYDFTLLTVLFSHFQLFFFPISFLKSEQLFMAQLKLIYMYNMLY